MWSKQQRLEWEQMKARVLKTYEQNRTDYLNVCKALGTGFYGSSHRAGYSRVSVRSDY
jgi:hypothetical protein